MFFINIHKFVGKIPCPLANMFYVLAGLFSLVFLAGIDFLTAGIEI